VSWKLPRTASEFQRAEFQLDAYSAPLFLQGCADHSGLLSAGRFQGEMEPDAVFLAGETGGVEEFLCPCGVQRILRDLGS
jgi:hypothetical protein